MTRPANGLTDADNYPLSFAPKFQGMQSCIATTIRSPIFTSERCQEKENAQTSLSEGPTRNKRRSFLSSSFFLPFTLLSFTVVRIFPQKCFTAR